MKKLLILLLITALIASLFACEKEPDVTKTAAETTAAADTTGAETETDGTDTETETEPVTEIQTQTETEPETTPVKETVYGIYHPMLINFDFKGSLTLYENGEYKSENSYTYDSLGIPVHCSMTGKGTYELDESGVDLELTPKTVTRKDSFDSDTDKETYLSNIKDQYSWGSIDGDTYDTLKKAANGGTEVSASYDTYTKAVLDNDTMTAYYLVAGLAPSDNEYYIAENDYTLVLNDDGTCRMRRETLENDEKGFGTYILSDVYEGTYTRSGDQATCVITQNTAKRRFTSDESEKAYKDYYEEQYSGGFLGKVYYDYYMALISEGGYTDADMSDKYIITVEEHTHTAIIVESPESEL